MPVTPGMQGLLLEVCILCRTILCHAMLCCVVQVMEFIIARLTSWGALMSLFPEGMPPIQNPAQPGELAVCWWPAADVAGWHCVSFGFS